MPVPPGKHHLWYGERHRQLRAQLKTRVDAGLETCRRCGKPIRPGEPFDLGHDDSGSPSGYRGPEHLRCNRGGSRSDLVTIPITSRDW